MTENMAASQGKLFVYGTLMSEEIVAKLLNRIPIMRSAMLNGFRRCGIRGEVFPAIVHGDPQDSVEGQVNIGPDAAFGNPVEKSLSAIL